MVENIAHVLTSLNVMKTFGDAFAAAKDEAERLELRFKYNEHLLQLQNSILQVQQDNIALVDEIRDLHGQVRELKDRATDLEDHILAEFASGYFCYVQKGFVGSYEKARKLCCNCYDNGKKATLIQYEGVTLGHISKWHCECNTCKSSWAFKEFNEAS